MTHWQVARSLYRVSLVLLFLLTLGGVTVLTLTFLHDGPGPPWWFALAWMVILAYNWYAFGRLPYAIHWEEGGAIEFQRFWGTTMVNPQDIVSLSGMFLWSGFLRLKHRDGVLYLFAQTTGMHEFITRLKAVNPRVRVTGT